MHSILHTVIYVLAPRAVLDSVRKFAVKHPHLLTVITGTLFRLFESLHWLLMLMARRWS